MKLNDLERAMLGGDHGATVKAAIEHQVKVGEFFGAADFVPVTQAHIMADTESLGEAGVTWLESLAGARVRVTKLLAQQLAAPRRRSFDAPLALEMLGFTGPEVKEGLAALREKRNPSFPPPPDDV